MNSLENKLAVVTGASTGIGKAIAVQLAEAGADVVVHYNSSAAEAEDTAQKISLTGKKAYLVKADLGNEEGSAQLEAEVKKIGSVNILVNNVGSAIKRTAFLEGSNELWETTWQVNVMSAVRATWSFLPDMTAAKWGRIINISSVASRSGGVPGSVHYATSKGAINLFTLSLSKEVGPLGVTVNAIAPGLIDTPFQVKTPGSDYEKAAAATPMRRVGYSEDIAPMAVYLASDAASFITGEIYYITGGR